MMDQILEQVVLSALYLEPSVDVARIRVTVRDGVATLTGDVETRAQKLAAKCGVENVPGVREVIDDLEVCPSKKSQWGFAHVGDDVLNALFWDLAAPADRVSVKCEKGWVTLTGEVERPYQKEAALRRTSAGPAAWSALSTRLGSRRTANRDGASPSGAWAHADAER